MFRGLWQECGEKGEDYKERCQKCTTEAMSKGSGFGEYVCLSARPGDSGAAVVDAPAALMA